MDAPESEGTEDTDYIGSDRSGEHNNWTSSGIVASDCAMPDSPENNFSTWNALFKGGEQSSSITATSTLSEGNLQVSVPTNSFMGNTFRPISGKWYCEFRVKTVGSANGEIDWGWIQATTYAGVTGHGGQANKWGGYYHAYSTDHIKVYDETSQLGSNINLTIAAGAVLQLAWDIDNNKGWIGINDTYYAADNGTDGNPSSGTNQTFTFTADEAENLQCYIANGTGTDVHTANFGQDSTFGGDETATSNADANGIGAFHHAPPTGFLAICSANLPELTIGPNSTSQSDDYFESVLYEGDGSTQNIAVNFKPDWTWIKNRDATDSHQLFDSNRGVTNVLQSDTTTAEVANDDTLTAFISTGFSLGDDVTVNTDAESYVAWNWLANGGTTVTNEAGSIDSTVQANTTAGFSIVTYTSASSGVYTIGHGLSQAPDLIINKATSAASAWWSFATLFDGSVDYVNLGSAEAKANDSASLGVPTSSVFSMVGNYTPASETNVAYCFHSVEGYSKINKYEGNAATDGAFVYTGFSPAFVLIKNVDEAGYNWYLYDNLRKPHNNNSKYLIPNTNGVETDYAGDSIDHLSNGFKLRTDANGRGTNRAVTFLYMAFAEAPFKYANAR